jgi:acyl-CoA synthetase (AMP-forming)/AMP-acid ligase II
MFWSEAATELSVDAHFRRQASRRPDHLAVVRLNGDGLTYAELDALADRYAHALLARDERLRCIALLLGHDVDLIAAALAALRIGAAVVTVNPGEPAARISTIRATVEPDIVVSSEPYRALARDAGFADDDIVDVSAVPAADREVTRVTAPARHRLPHLHLGLDRHTEGRSADASECPPQRSALHEWARPG